jgi:hypothetical protein
MPWPEPVTLVGPHARLEPLSHAHLDGLTEAVKDGELWKLWYTSIPKPEDMAKEIDRRLGLQKVGSMLPFTVFDAEGRIAGMSTYMNVDAANRRVEIGSTWYAKRVQRSALNTQCKLLLLTHAFENSIALRSSSARISSITRAGAASSAWAPSRTEFCVTIRSLRMARCAIRLSSASSPRNGRRRRRISRFN